MSNFEDNVVWELAPENAHPKAKEKLKEAFLWSNVDDNSPLGNDTGADVLHHYRDWLSNNPLAKTTEFLTQILKSWEIQNKSWSLLDENKLLGELEKNYYPVLVGDDTVIALAFAQIVLEGKVDREIKRKALWAIKRQGTNVVLDFRGWDEYKQERIERLQIMKNMLEEF